MFRKNTLLVAFIYSMLFKLNMQTYVKTFQQVFEAVLFQQVTVNQLVTNCLPFMESDRPLVFICARQ